MRGVRSGKRMMRVQKNGEEVEMDQSLLFDSSRAPKTGGNRRQTVRVE